MHLTPPAARLPRRGLPAVSARTAAGLALALVLAAVAAFWLAGGFGAAARWALEQQRAIQGLLGESLQALRGGRPGAALALVGLSAAYGFVHAVGPGHGKVLVTGAALGTSAGAGRMAAIALAGSLAQALLAIALVYGAFLLFGATARGALGLEAALEPAGHLAVALVGAWLVARGLWAARHPAACGCGHHHAPAPAAATASLREALALAAAMAVRPCAGALIVLVLAWRMDLAAAGAAAVIAMGLGTAAFTAAVAAAAVTGRKAALFSAGPVAGARRLGPALQIAAGTLVLGVSGALLCAAVAAG